MGLTVYWTRFAENRLNDIFNYYRFEAGLEVARKIVDGLIDRSLKLERHPYLGPKEQLLAKRNDDFRYLVYKNYKIIYRINPIHNRIDILNVFDCRQNPTKMDEMK